MKENLEKQKVKFKVFKLIYKLFEDIEKIEFEEEFDNFKFNDNSLGFGVVKDIFNVSQ